RRTGIRRVAVTEAEDARVGTLAQHDRFKSESEIFAFAAFEFEFPVVTVFLAHFENEFRFAGGMKAEIEVVADGAAVDLDDPVAGFEIHVGAQTFRRDLRDLDAAPADAGNCWCNCKLVHFYLDILYNTSPSTNKLTTQVPLC